MTKFWASDENFCRRKFSPTKIFTDEVFASKVCLIEITSWDQQLWKDSNLLHCRFSGARPCCSCTNLTLFKSSYFLITVRNFQKLTWWPPIFVLKELCHPSTALFARGKSFCTWSSTLWNGEHCLKINIYYNKSKTFRHVFSIFVCVSGGGLLSGGLFAQGVNVQVVNVRGVIVQGVNVRLPVWMHVYIINILRELCLHTLLTYLDLTSYPCLKVLFRFHCFPCLYCCYTIITCIHKIRRQH